MEVFRSLGGEAGAIHQRAYTAEVAEVIVQSLVFFFMVEKAVAIAKRVVLGAFTSRPTRNASFLAIDLVDGQVGVSWTLLALVGFLLNVVAWGAGYT